MIGETISHYRILEKLGEGGMGVVYKAEDTGLRRTIALKFLAPDAIGSKEARARFLREARMAASLNHPNICTIHEVGETRPSDPDHPDADLLPPGSPFIAMELVEGETLAEVCGRSGPLGGAHLLDLALQVADGLAAAHAEGIVHRDLKPQNVMVMATGRAKILDFGLAKPIPVGKRAESQEDAVTETMLATGPRVVVGTVSYMSPEQARGKPVDSRSDVFSFGTMLYEMATGKRPFRGETTTDTVAQIIEREPLSPSGIRRDIPVELERIILRCLSKDAGDRYHDTRDLVVELRELRHQIVGTTTGRRAAASLRRTRLLRVGIPVAVVLILVIVAGWWWASRRRPVSHGEVKVTRLTALRAGATELKWPALSPDGRKLAYIYKGDLELVLLESGDLRTLIRAEEDSLFVHSVDWHPDSEQLLVEEWGRRENQTWLLNIVTNRRRLIYVDTTATYPIVSPDGERLALLRNGSRELAILCVGSDSLQVLRRSDEGSIFTYPIWSPSGTRLAYRDVRVRPPSTTSNCWTCDLSGNPRVVEMQGLGGLVTDGRGLCWLPDGRLVFARRFGSPPRSQLWAIKVDPGTGVTKGSPRKLFDRPSANVSYLTASADGKRLAFDQQKESRRLQMLEMGEDRGGSDLHRLSVEDWPASTGVWSRDGQRIFFAIERNESQRDIYLRNLGSSREEPFVTEPGWKEPVCLSPDGLNLLYWHRMGESWELMSISVDGGLAKVFARFGAAKPRHVLGASVPGGPLVTGVQRDDELIVRRLGPDGIPAPESLRVELAGESSGAIWADMDISPDGTQLVLLWRDGSIRLVDLQGGEARELGNALPPWRRELGVVQFVSWSRNGAWLYFSGGGWFPSSGQASSSPHWYSVWRLSLDRVTLEVLWESEDTWPSVVRPSPDGRGVAFNTWEWENDVWMIEGF